jgi:hypothetical protein
MHSVIFAPWGIVFRLNRRELTAVGFLFLSEAILRFPVLGYSASGKRVVLIWPPANEKRRRRMVS